MENVNYYKEKCEHSKIFNRIFSLVFFLISQLSLILLCICFVLLVAGNEKINLPATITFIVFVSLYLLPMIIINLIFFIVSIVKGKNNAIFSISTIFLSKSFLATILIGGPTNVVYYIDFILLAISLIIYAILETKFYNKEKGKLLTILQCIKYAFIIALLIVGTHFIKGTSSESPLTSTIHEGVFTDITVCLVDIFIPFIIFIPFWFYLSQFNKKILKSCIVADSIISSIALIVCLYSIFGTYSIEYLTYLIENAGSTSGMYKDTLNHFMGTFFIDYLLLLLFSIYLIYSIVLTIVTHKRINKLKAGKKEENNTNIETEAEPINDDNNENIEIVDNNVSADVNQDVINESKEENVNLNDEVVENQTIESDDEEETIEEENTNNELKFKSNLWN